MKLTYENNINPYLDKNLYKRKELTFKEYIEGIENQDRVVLSKAITLLESEREKDQILARELIHYFLKKPKDSFRIGITGIPGVGKSTFIEAFGLYLIKKGHKIAVLAVDPSSEKSGGSILGDKTRMENLNRENNAFIRPSPSRGNLGGVARKTRESILLCESAGFDRIIIETVGVGQGETLVHSMVDFFLLLILPNSGDELQGIKKGIMEMADGIIITKADGDNLTKAKIAAEEIKRALHYFSLEDPEWQIPILLTSSYTGFGIPEVYEVLEKFIKHRKTKVDHKRKISYFQLRREIQSLYWYDQNFLDGIKKVILNLISDDYEYYKKLIQLGEITPFEASEKLLEKAKLIYKINL